MVGKVVGGLWAEGWLFDFVRSSRSMIMKHCLDYLILF